jgi:hypothetical protein
VTKEATSLIGKRSKLIAIVLVVVVLGAGFGYWLLAPKMLGQLVTYTTQQTSIVTSSEESVTTLASSTTLASGTNLWINVTATKPVSYYLSQLKSTGTQPYVQLAWELQALPDATNATAVAKITYLALNATNPEVKEAFELMMKGGTPSPSDFAYTVPKYNTELQVLYWLACQNELKKDDTLALAIAMVNGLWVTMGDPEVRDAVRKDAGDLLVFFRETNELQKQRGYYQLEDYPLEGKIPLAWTGGIAVDGPSDQPFRLEDLRGKRIDRKVYDWHTVSVGTLRKMQALVYDRWVDQNVTLTFSRMEEYFYFSGFNEHMDYQAEARTIVVDNESVPNRHINNVDWEFRHFEETGKILGVCNDEATFVAALAKSVGIAATEINVNWKTDGHTLAIYFDPVEDYWRMYGKQMLNINIPDDDQVYAYVFRPPVYEGFKYKQFTAFEGRNLVVGYPFYLVLGKKADIRSYFVSGLPSEAFKRWIFSVQ